MINYVNNAFDKTLKPCDAQQFGILTQRLDTEKLILAHRAGDAKAKPKLPALTYMGVLDVEKYKTYLHQCEEQGVKTLGSRRIEFMRPTGLFMLDFDHVGKQAESPLPAPPEGGEPQASRIDSPMKLWEYIQERYSAMSESSPSGGVEGAIALAHITPSGDGLRVVVKRPAGKTIEQAQYEWCEAVLLSDVCIKPDPACKDISRLSFAPMQREILYFNPSLLFMELPEASDYPADGAPLFSPQKGGSPTIVEQSAMTATPPPSGGGWEEAYNGVPYSEIVTRLEEQLGGRPEHGARNSFIFTMACNLRYICNDDAQWIASILPTYGEDPQKYRTTIASAVNRPMSREMPETLARALRISKMYAEDGASHSPLGGSREGAPPALPGELPAPVSLLTSRTPEAMRPAVAMAVFPPLGAHLHGVNFRYWDGRDYEPTFMNVLVAELSSGKSAVNTPIQYIVADMKARDAVARTKMQTWRDACAGIASTKDKPERPKGLCVQCLSPDMTNAAFVQRLSDAEGRFLYTMMDEIELLNALKTNTQGNTVSAILRLAFDCGDYGQERVASNAIDAQVQVRWNWNASTTIQRVRKFFAKNIADGTLSRLSFATIVKDDEDWGDMQRPTFGEYGTKFADELRPYIDALCSASGTILCPEAIKWADALSLDLIGYAREIDDRTYAQLSFRAVLMGFFRAVLLYVMNGCQWTSTIADFAEWTVRYDLWCKFRFFRDMLHKDLSGEKAALQRGPVSLLSLLPEEFTKQQVRELRIAEGMAPDPRKMLDNWKRRDYVVFDDARKVFVKCPQSSVLS